LKIAENDLKIKTHRNRMGYSDLQPPPISPSENLRIGKDQQHRSRWQKKRMKQMKRYESRTKRRQLQVPPPPSGLSTINSPTINQLCPASDTVRRVILIGGKHDPPRWRKCSPETKNEIFRTL
jgi:hypothetical protein